MSQRANETQLLQDPAEPGITAGARSGRRWRMRKALQAGHEVELYFECDTSVTRPAHDDAGKASDVAEVAARLAANQDSAQRAEVELAVQSAAVYQLRQEVRDLTKQRNGAQDALKDALGDAREWTDGRYRVELKAQADKQAVDWQALAEAMLAERTPVEIAALVNAHTQTKPGHDVLYVKRLGEGGDK